MGLRWIKPRVMWYQKSSHHVRLQVIFGSQKVQWHDLWDSASMSYPLKQCFDKIRLIHSWCVSMNYLHHVEGLLGSTRCPELSLINHAWDKVRYQHKPRVDLMNLKGQLHQLWTDLMQNWTKQIILFCTKSRPDLVLQTPLSYWSDIVSLHCF